MSLPGKPLPGFFTVSIFSNDRNVCLEALTRFEKRYGKAHLPLCEYPFTHTDYYQGEMGGPLHKILAGFPKLSSREKLGEAKHFGIKVEKHFAKKGDMSSRSVNVDPGFLTLENFVLLTCKNFAHKIYLGKGVFADLTLIYESDKKHYRPLPWSFKDYTEMPVGSYLLALRAKLKEALKNYFLRQSA